jgi:ketol-acid reductoisomerase
VAPSKDIDVTMIAPKAPGIASASCLSRGGGTPALIAHPSRRNRPAKAQALSYAKGIASRARV